jgi:threonine synthase
VSASEAILQGLSQEGGLFVPEKFPELDYRSMHDMTYEEMALSVFSLYFTDFDPIRLKEMISSAYSPFNSEKRVEIVRVGDQSIMELFHGPTLAFKDMALSILPYLMVESKEILGVKEKTVILTATSGDTGKAALEGFSDVEGTEIIVFYPEEGVSRVQKLQMVTQGGDNTHVVAISGNFDDAQRAVKEAFQSPSLKEELESLRMAFSSANSINIGRLVPQIVYYFHGYIEMVRQGHIEMGSSIPVCVPTGNFGNILAAYYAKRMGLPLGNLICASNDNHILTDFIQTGVYDTDREFIKTISPSMDILISSNLERFVFEMVERDEAQMKKMMADLTANGRFDLSEEALKRVQALMSGNYTSESAIEETISQCLDQYDYLLDPHTAVAYRVSEGVGNALIASTASPYKFGQAILTARNTFDSIMTVSEVNQAIEKLSGQPIPESISGIEHREILHKGVSTIDNIENAILTILKEGKKR